LGFRSERTQPQFRVCRSRFAPKRVSSPRSHRVGNGSASAVWGSASVRYSAVQELRHDNNRHSIRG
jgi:hypothetical protein